jgi:hypothetical protein
MRGKVSYYTLSRRSIGGGRFWKRIERTNQGNGVVRNAIGLDDGGGSGDG